MGDGRCSRVVGPPEHARLYNTPPTHF
jgi:hypothetical protein